MRFLSAGAANPDGTDSTDKRFDQKFDQFCPFFIFTRIHIDENIKHQFVIN